MNKAHPRVDMFYIFLKLALVFTWTFSAEDDYYSKVVVATLVPAAMFVAHNNFYPYYGLWICQLRCSLYAGAVLVGITSLISTVIWSAMG